MKRKLALCAAVLCLTMALSPSAFAAESVVISQSSGAPGDLLPHLRVPERGWHRDPQVL